MNPSAHDKPPWLVVTDENGTRILDGPNTIAARGESLAAFDGGGVPAGC